MIDIIIIFFVGIVLGASISAAVFAYKFKKISKEYEAALANYVLSVATYAKMFDTHVYWMNSIIAWLKSVMPELEQSQPISGIDDPFKSKGN
jgi:hypothetical protein